MTGPQQPAQDDTGHRETASGIGAPNVEPAGSRLDRLVAEKVMGYTIYHYDKDVAARCYYSLCDEEGDPIAPDYKGGRFYGERATEAEAWGDCPAFSADIAAAWPVHLAMCEKLFSVRRRYFAAMKEQTRALAGGSLVAWPDVLVVLRHDFPEAICRAALASCSLPDESAAGAATPATDAAADVPHETPDLQP